MHHVVTVCVSKDIVKLDVLHSYKRDGYLPVAMKFSERQSFKSRLLTSRICVPKVPFRFFDKLKYEIRNKVLIFVSILKLRQKTSK